MNVYLPFTPRLPSEYQEVEYIQSSGTQYINTGYIPSNNTKIKCKIGSWNTSIGRYETMYGARKQYSTSNSQGFYIDYDNNGSGGHNYGFGKDYSSSSLFTFQDGGIHIIEQSSNGLYQDGILKKTFDAMTFTSPVNMCIYALNDNGTIKEYGGFKLYFFKIWNSGTLVRDFVPCYRKSDSVIGLYDLVNNQFYTNAGTGTFSKGNDVTMTELKNAYIGEVWTPGSNTIAYYQLTSTTTVNDMSGNNRNGTKYGTINFSTYNGVDCAYFNGGSNYIQVPYDSGMSTSSITISLWAKTLEYDGNRGLVYKGQFTGQNGIYAIAITQYQGYSFDWRINGTRHGCNVFDGNNIWTHILVDFNGSTGHVYKNGSLISTFSQSQSISSDTNKLILGAYFNSSYCFYGYLSNIILENKVWTATEVSNYYNLTKSNYGL